MKKTVAKCIGILLILACAVGLMTACKSDEVSGIKVKNAATLRTNYLLGQDLDWNTGVLSVTTKDGNKEVPFTDGGVSISGYDKNTLGEQTVTVSYGGKSATIKVKVLQPVFVENHTELYFVNEKFDFSAGRLVVMHDDAAGSDTVKLSAADITIKDGETTVDGNYTFAAVGNKELTVTHGTHSAKFTVAVKDVANAVFRAPQTKSYRTYDTELRVSGGRIILTSADGDSKTVELTADMCSGYDPSVVTEENLTTELQQEITVSYVNRSWTYKVGIKYSYLPQVLSLTDPIVAENYQFIDIINGKLVKQITDAHGQNALDAVQLYKELDAIEKSKLPSPNLDAMASTAAIYGYNELLRFMKKYDDLIGLDTSSGAFSVGLNCADYQLTKNAIVAIKADDDFKLLCNTLELIYFAHGNVVLGKSFGKEIKIKDAYTLFKSMEWVSDLTAVAEYQVTLYEILKDVPVAESYTDASAETQNAVKAAIASIKDSDYRNDSRHYFGIVRRWRADFFDIIYDVCYAKKGTADEADYNVEPLCNVAFPSKLEKIYNDAMSALQLSAEAWERLQFSDQVIAAIQQSPPDGYEFPTDAYFDVYVANSRELPQVDATEFMRMYLRTKDAVKEILDGSDAKEQHYYDTLFITQTNDKNEEIKFSLQDIVSLTDSSSQGNYCLMAGSLANDDAATALWRKYITIVERYVEKRDTGTADALVTYLQSTAVKTSVTDMLNTYFALTPAQQINFLRSINMLYSQFGWKNMPEYAFSYMEIKDSKVVQDASLPASLLAEFLFAYYDANLLKSNTTPILSGTPVKNMVFDMLIATELYARGDIKEFVAKQKALKTKYDDSDPDVQNLFNNELSACYTKYNDIAALFTDEGAYNGGEVSDEWTTKFAAFKAEVVELQKVHDRVGVQQNLSKLIAAYETVSDMYTTLKGEVEQSGLDAVKNMFYHKPQIRIASKDYTFDYAMTEFRYYYAQILIAYGIWDSYQAGGANSLKEFMPEVYSFLKAYGNTAPDAKPSLADATAVLNGFSDLADPFEKFVFLIGLDNDGKGSFSEALRGTFKANLTENVYNAVDKLLVLQQRCVEYNGSDITATIKEKLKVVYDEFQAAYNALQDADKTSFDTNFGSLKSACESAYNALIAKA